VILVIGFFFVEGDRGTRLIVIGLVLASLGGLELSIREHFAGYRSHSTLLAGVAGMAALLASAYAAQLTVGVSLAIGAAVGTAAFVLFARAFRARTGRLAKLR
jgi:drug/metabolite transporter (DMT)-like permease